jgi:MYXO-CTERM domain-containing protein
MKRATFTTSVLAMAALSASSAFATTTTNDFSSGVGSGWTVDRYAPQVFDTTVTNHLRLGLRASGNLANRPDPYNNSFYNYQGMQQSVTGAETGSTIAIDMYVDGSWLNGARAGIWGVFSNSGGVSGYPIIEYTKGTNTDGSIGDGNFTGFRYWDDVNGWVEQATAIQTNAWYRMTIGLTASNSTYSISDVATGSVVASYNVSSWGSTSISALILQGGNKGPAGDYDILFDNLTVNAVPAPGALALLGIAGFASRRRRA